jgi:nucleotide-binding universal stress UspA family protein
MRNLPEGVELELLRGVPAEEIVAAAEAHHADLVVLGWSQRLSAGRAPTVRRALVEGSVPVMLLGTGTEAR